jgi:hypothetical protein
MLLQAGCASSQENGTQNIIITDRIGRDWDITHAQYVYGMDPRYFNFGLGVGTIPSVDNPRVIEEGDPEYPPSDSRLAVFGLNHNGEQRAYAVEDLSRHEVFNDQYPGNVGNYIAVTF